jgi:uncharacterized protein YjbI with pentapeptide repeats
MSYFKVGTEPVIVPKIKIMSCIVLFIVAGFCFNPSASWALRDAPPPPLSFSNAQLSHRDFAGQSLITAEFSNANLEFANFTNANLKGAVMSSANLTKANLAGADLSTAMMDQADLEGADLSNAVLNETILFRSLFLNTTITGADFTDALLDGYQIAQLCTIAQGVNPKTGIATRDSLGCKAAL